MGGEQTDTQKFGESLLFSFLNVAANEVLVLGSILSEARLNRAQMFMERRLSALTEEWKRQMETVKEETVDWEFVRSETFFDLLRQAVEVAVRTRDQQKIEFVARVLRGATVEGGQEGYSPEEYLGLLLDLTSTAFVIVVDPFYGSRSARRSPGRPWLLLPKSPFPSPRSAPPSYEPAPCAAAP